MDIIQFQDERALQTLADHKVLALPTETVYGLGVYWDDPLAYERLVAVKNRRPDKAIACMCADDFDFDRYFVIDDRIRAVMKAFLPGPLTILVHGKETTPFQSHLGTHVCGIRVPGKEDLLAFLRKAKKPLQVTSANLSGHPALYTCEAVYEQFSGSEDVPCLVRGTCDSDVPTTVVDLTGEKPILIRQGEIRLEDIEKEFHYGQHQDD